MIFVHMADAHLGAKPAYQKKDIVWDAFYEVIRKCNEIGADILLIAGDLFHRQPMVNELDEVNYQFRKLKKTRVVIIAGNHDYVAVGSAYRDYKWMDNVTFLMGDMKTHCLDKVYFNDINTTVYGFSYSDEYDAPVTRQRIYDDVYPDADDDGYRILLGHGGDDRNIPVKITDVIEHEFDYAAFGHIHKPDITSECAAYSGSLVPLDITHTGEHGYIIGNAGANGTSINFITIKQRQFVDMNISCTSEDTKGSLIDRMEKCIKDNGKENYYTFNIVGFRNINMAFAFDDMDMPSKEGVCAGGIVRINDFTHPEFDYDSLQAQNSDNIIGMFIAAMKGRQIDEEIKVQAMEYGVSALLAARKGQMQ